MLGRPRKFVLRPRGELIPPSANSAVVSFGICSEDGAVVLWADGDSAAATAHGRDPVVLHGALPESPMVQALPGGRFLVVGARSEWRDGGGEDNAFVYGPDGSVELAGCLGDGIEHVQVADDGTIWVGYFDEGVYGNLGWGMGAGAEPIGRSGIVQFTPALEVAWEFPSDDEPIDDCYALNVIGEDAWACPYSSFDVVRIRGGSVEHWENDVEGARAMAVSGDLVALVGGYAKNGDRVVIQRLGEELEPERRGRLTMPNGRRLPEDAVVVGRGAEIHVLAGLEWFTWSLADHRVS